MGMGMEGVGREWIGLRGGVDWAMDAIRRHPVTYLSDSQPKPKSHASPPIPTRSRPHIRLAHGCHSAIRPIRIPPGARRMSRAR